MIAVGDTPHRRVRCGVVHIRHRISIVGPGSFLDSLTASSSRAMRAARDTILMVKRAHLRSSRKISLRAACPCVSRPGRERSGVRGACRGAAGARAGETNRRTHSRFRNVNTRGMHTRERGEYEQKLETMRSSQPDVSRFPTPDLPCQPCATDRGSDPASTIHRTPITASSVPRHLQTPCAPIAPRPPRPRSAQRRR